MMFEYTHSTVQKLFYLFIVWLFLFIFNKKIVKEEINTIIQQECIKLIKSDNKDIYNVTNYLYKKNPNLHKIFVVQLWLLMYFDDFIKQKSIWHDWNCRKDMTFTDLEGCSIGQCFYFAVCHDSDMFN